MERAFLLNHYPDVAARSELSNSTGLSEAQVQVSTALGAKVRSEKLMRTCELRRSSLLFFIYLLQFYDNKLTNIGMP